MKSRSGPRILICRLSAVGDCILTTPLLCALRDHFPDCFLAWVVQRGAASLLTGHECLDRLIVVPRDLLKSWSGVRSIRRELRNLQFDVALDAQSLSKSSALAWLSGAPRRIGFNPPRGREAAPWLNNELVSQRASHLVDCQLELLEPLGVPRPERVAFRLPRDAAAEETAARLIASAHLTGGFVAVNPGAGWDSKLWPADRYGIVARTLGERRQTPSLVVWAGPREKAWAEQIVARSGGHALLAPATTLPELAAVLRRARLFLGSDTGPLHLAAAVGTPCVGLHGPTRPQDCGPYGAQHITLQQWLQTGTSRQRRRASNDAMQAIEIEHAVAACEEILDRDGASSGRTNAA